MAIRLTQEQFEQLVDEAMDSLPEEFRQYLANMRVEVRPRPTRQELAQAKVDDPRALLGLYTGVPLPDKSVSAPFEWPEQVLIFQRNIEAICDSPDEVVEEVRRTVLHEVGHHFGMDEEDLDALGY